MGESFLTEKTPSSRRSRWARLRFSIIGPLLAAPPAAGELHSALAQLCTRVWRHPLSGVDVRFGVSTVERWYYAARRAQDPVAALARRLRGDIGGFPGVSPAAAQLLGQQYREHPGWTMQLHLDNLRVLLKGGPIPAPVTERSGKKSWVHWRWQCPTFLRQTFVEWAGQTINKSFWAGAYYRQQRDKGSSYQAAVRALAFKWIRILYQCWITRTPYNESTYLNALRKRGSPLLKSIDRNAKTA